MENGTCPSCGYVHQTSDAEFCDKCGARNPKPDFLVKSDFFVHTKANELGACRKCEYTPVAFGAVVCPRYGAPNPNPTFADRIVGRAALVGGALGAISGGVGALVTEGKVGIAIFAAVLFVLPGLILGFIFGILAGIVAWLIGYR